MPKWKEKIRLQHKEKVHYKPNWERYRDTTAKPVRYESAYNHPTSQLDDKAPANYVVSGTRNFEGNRKRSGLRSAVKVKRTKLQFILHSQYSFWQ